MKMIISIIVTVFIFIIDLWYTYWLRRRGLKEANPSMTIVINKYSVLLNYVITILIAGGMLTLLYFTIPDYLMWFAGFMSGYGMTAIHKNYLVYKKRRKK